MTMAGNFTGQHWSPHEGSEDARAQDYHFPSDTYSTPVTTESVAFSGSGTYSVQGYANQYQANYQVQQNSYPYQLQHAPAPAYLGNSTYNPYTTGGYGSSITSTSSPEHYQVSNAAVATPRITVWPSRNSVEAASCSSNYGQANQAAFPYARHGSTASPTRSPSTEGDQNSSETTWNNDKKKHICSYPGCPAAFARKADRDRHITCVHERATSIKYPCKYKKCTRKGENAFTRKDHLREHVRNYHKQDIPKKVRTRGHEDDEVEDEEEEADCDHSGSLYEQSTSPLDRSNSPYGPSTSSYLA